MAQAENVLAKQLKQIKYPGEGAFWPQSPENGETEWKKPILKCNKEDRSDSGHRLTPRQGMLLVHGLLHDSPGTGVYTLKHNWAGRRLRAPCLCYLESTAPVAINNKNGPSFYIYNHFNKTYLFGFYHILVAGMKQIQSSCQFYR